MNQNSRRVKISLFVLAMALLILLSSCFPGTIESEGRKQAGFLMGIWHGWIAPISLIVRLFKPEVRIYEAFNTGWWYDFGFYMAIISGFGGLSLARKKDNRDYHHRRDS